MIGKDTLYQQRTNTLTDREVLQMAAGELDTAYFEDHQHIEVILFFIAKNRKNREKML